MGQSTNNLDQHIQPIKTTLVSRNITVMGRRTSVRLEPEMWLALKEISIRESCSIHDICTLVSARKKSAFVTDSCHKGFSDVVLQGGNDRGGPRQGRTRKFSVHGPTGPASGRDHAHEQN